MNYIDILCLVVILLFGIIGFKKGALRTIISLVGFFLVIILSYYLKDPIASFLIKRFPFFNLGSLSSLNLLIYQAISFFLIYAVLMVALKIVLKVTKIIDKLIKATVIFELPSKIIGAIIGLAEGVVVTFIISFILVQIAPTQKYILDSKVASKILDNTPIINKIFKKTIESSKDIYNIIKTADENNEILNDEILNSLVDNEVFTKDFVQDIIKSGKIKQN